MHRCLQFGLRMLKISQTLWATATLISSHAMRRPISILSFQLYYSLHEISRIKVQPHGRLGLATWLHTSSTNSCIECGLQYSCHGSRNTLKSTRAVFFTPRPLFQPPVCLLFVRMFESLTNKLCPASNLTPGAATNRHHQAGVDGRWYSHDNTQVTLI